MKRVSLSAALALALVFSLSLALVSAQDTGGDGSSLDDLPPGATPEPLPTRLAQPAPASRIAGAGAALELFFTGLEQGETGLLRVTGNSIVSVRSRFLEHRAEFFRAADDSYYGLIAVNMEQTARPYPLDVFVQYEDGGRETLSTEITVMLGGFIRQDVALKQDKAFLVNPDIERNELARLESLVAISTARAAWDSTGFQLPILSTLTSPFGAFRTFNATLNTRHTGWDIRAPLGTPILASAAGTVAFAGFMDIRGNYVLVDHGYGVYSGYAHTSQTHVTRGQEVAKGQVLGLVGDTGRTSGSHFHWEMTVNGVWVDSVQFVEMWMP